jgi:hypothetical protein
VQVFSRRTAAQPQRSGEIVRRKLAPQRERGLDPVLQMRPHVGHGFFDVGVHRDTTPRRIQRKPDDEEDARKREAEQTTTEQAEKPQGEAKQAEAKQPEDRPADTSAKTEGEGKTTGQATPTAPSTVTPGGHRAAPKGVAACPDAPLKEVIVHGCTAAPAAAPPAKEKAELPTPSSARFGGNADRAKFAKELAQCHAERVVADEIKKRYTADVEAAKKTATAEAKTESEEAVKKATKGLTDKREIAKATSTAQAEARKAAAKKIADAAAAVKKQDVATVTAELATKFEDALADDFDNTIKGAFVTLGGNWLRTMQSRLDTKRLQITKEKNAKPKVAKGETPPPAKSPDEIAKEIEADMTEVRCEEKGWALQQIENVAHGWAVGRREQVDFDTIKQSASYLGKFEATYTPTTTVDIPVDIQSQKGMPGVAPEMADFLTALKSDPKTAAFKAGNYKGHGGLGFAGKGFSADLTISGPLDQRGFFQPKDAVAFLLQIDATAKAQGARWRVLYNDFRVAEEVNAATGTRNVGFWGVSDPKGLNWHGPLILHFHLDLEIPKKPAPTTTPTPQGGSTP